MMPMQNFLAQRGGLGMRPAPGMPPAAAPVPVQGTAVRPVMGGPMSPAMPVNGMPARPVMPVQPGQPGMPVNPAMQAPPAQNFLRQRMGMM